jgi:hypothetical protein
MKRDAGMSYLTLQVEAERAKQRLTEVFQEQRTELSPGIKNRVDRSKKTSEPRWLSPVVTRPGKSDFWKRGSSVDESGNAGKDMSTSSFVLTLLLSGTIAAANTDQPLFWLSIGPAPLAVVLATIFLFRSRFDLLARIPNSRALK